MRAVVADAGPVIHLYEAKALGLLDVLGKVFVPQAVANEVSCVVGNDLSKTVFTEAQAALEEL